MATKDPKKALKPAVELILAQKIAFRDLERLLQSEAFYGALKACYGNSTKAAELLGVGYQQVLNFKRDYCPDTEWPEKPNPDANKVRLDNHSPITDIDFFPEETELDPT